MEFAFLRFLSEWVRGILFKNKDCCRLEQDTPTDDENPFSIFSSVGILMGITLPIPSCLLPAGRKENQMARPGKSDSAVLKHRFVVRFSDTQYTVIKRYADQLGISMAEYIRRQTTHSKVSISYPIVVSIPELQKVTVELSRIGNNLNQIARHFNTGGMQSKVIREDINACIAEIMRTSKELMEMAGEFNGNTQTSNK